MEVSTHRSGPISPVMELFHLNKGGVVHSTWRISWENRPIYGRIFRPHFMTLGSSSTLSKVGQLRSHFEASQGKRIPSDFSFALSQSHTFFFSEILAQYAGKALWLPVDSHDFLVFFLSNCCWNRGMPQFQIPQGHRAQKCGLWGDLSTAPDGVFSGERPQSLKIELGKILQHQSLMIPWGSLG